MGLVPRRYSLTELDSFHCSMVWLNWICALFFFMVLVLPGCQGATWTEEDERLAREQNLGKIISRARNNGRTLGDFTPSKPFGSLSSQTRGSSPRTLGGFVSSRPSSGSVQSPLSQVLRGSASPRVSFGGFSSDGFPSTRTSSSSTRPSDRFSSTSASLAPDGPRNVFDSQGRFRTTARKPAGVSPRPSGSSISSPRFSDGTISSSVSSQRQGSSIGSSRRQGSSTGSSQRQGSSTGSSRRQGSSTESSQRQGSSTGSSQRQGSSTGSSTGSSQRQGSSNG